MILLLIILIWLAGVAGTVYFSKPEGAVEGALVLVCALIAWPFLAVGWLVSRPWS